MPTIIGFETVQKYLNAIADNNGLILSSPHKAFWQIPYERFVKEDIPAVKCNNAPIPIIRQDAPEQSPFFLIMTDPNGWCNKQQMPPGGPNIDPNNDATQIIFDDGTTITAKQIREDIIAWLTNGYPKDSKVIPDPAPIR